MPDRPWKQFEREMGKLLGGTRFWANSGESVDCEGPVFLAQCKHVKSMSLNELVKLAKKAEYDGKNRVSKKLYYKNVSDLSDAEEYSYSDPRIGLVGVKTRPGRGKKSTTLVVMTGAVFHELFPTGGKHK